MDINERESLNILQWNANSLLNRVHELYDFMNENHIHIACISETFLVGSDVIPAHPNFVHYRLDRMNLPENQRSGGVAIIIRSDINHHPMSNLSTRLLEAIGIEVCLEDSTRIQIISAYLPGGSTTTHINQHYKNDIQLLINRHCSYFVMGDFNSRHRLWNCTRANTAGNILFNEHQRHQFLIYHPDEPTYFPTQQNYTPSYIDLTLTNAIHEISDSLTHESSSDHQIITHKIELNCHARRRHARLIPLFKAANWD